MGRRFKGWERERTGKSCPSPAHQHCETELLARSSVCSRGKETSPSQSGAVSLAADSDLIISHANVPCELEDDSWMSDVGKSVP